MPDSQITIELSERGVLRVQIAADNSREQTHAHLLLAMIAPELRALDRALKGLRPRAGQ